MSNNLELLVELRRIADAQERTAAAIESVLEEVGTRRRPERDESTQPPTSTPTPTNEPPAA